MKLRIQHLIFTGMVLFSGRMALGAGEQLADQLHMAIFDKNPARVRQLINEGAKPTREILGDAIITLANTPVGKEILPALIDKANINEQNKRGETPLMLAIARGDLDLVKQLLNRNAELNIKNKAGQSTLAWAREALADSKQIASSKPSFAITQASIAEEKAKVDALNQIITLLEQKGAK